MLLDNQWITEEIKEEIKEDRETNNSKNTAIQSLGCSKSSSKTEIYSNLFAYCLKILRERGRTVSS